MLAENPETLLISISGWTREIYERLYKDGDIEKVSANMREVAKLKGPKTHVQVSWYKDRLQRTEHEEPLMQEFAESLGFACVPTAPV